MAALSILLSLSAICLVRSRGAFVVMLISLSCAALLTRWRLGLLCSAAVLVVALTIDSVSGFPLLSKFGRVLDDRLSLWTAAWAMFRDAPWFGHGFHTFVLFYHAYLQGVELSAWVPIDQHASVPWAHNLYLETLAEQGVIGFAGLSGMLGFGLLTVWRVRQTLPLEACFLASGVFAGLVGFCVAAMVELSFLRQWVVMILFVLLGVGARLVAVQTQDTKGDI